MSRITSSLMLLAMTSCSLSPEFEMPDVAMPASYKEQPAEAQMQEVKGNWAEAKPLEKEDRGQWWKIFGDEQLNDLEKQAADANPSVQAAAARVEQARANVRANAASFLPDIGIGANAVRQKPASAELAAFGQPPTQLKPFTMYSAQGTVSYEADLFGRVRDTEKAANFDADATDAAYRSVLLALQADVAQHYFSLREADAERKLLRETITIRQEALRIMQKRYDLGEGATQDLSRTQSELASTQAELIALDRNRANLEHTLAVLLGKMPSEFMLAEMPLEPDAAPREIPAGIPASLLERRPDIASAIASMQAANTRIGVARTAFFPLVELTAAGGFESLSLRDLFLWQNRTWALGQLAGSAITMPIFDNGRNQAHLDFAHAQYDEAVGNYRNQLLTAFRDVEDNLSDQRQLAEQSLRAETAAKASEQTTDLTRKRYDQGDADYFEVVTVQRDSLAPTAPRCRCTASGFLPPWRSFAHWAAAGTRRCRRTPPPATISYLMP